MRAIGCLAFAALVATPAQAQDISLAYRGSGPRAGGPAYLYYDAVQPRFVPHGSEPIGYAPRPRAGQMSGGPAREFILQDRGPASLEGTVHDPARSVPFGTARSGQRAGGSQRF